MKILIFYIAIASDIALAFPEMIRHGYPACGSCHVSTAGGGALTAYGRSNSGQLMSTLFYEGGENPLYGLITPPAWLEFGGDARYINYTVKSGGLEFTRMFVMQRDIEVAVKLSDSVTVGGSYGLYGEDQRPEQRRSYVMVQFTDNIRARVGRFIPTYGILQPDHTLSTRSGMGLGQGDETYNAELSFSGKRGEVFITGVGGRKLNVKMSEAKGYETRSDDYSGGVFSAALFLGKSAKLGVNAMALSAVDHTRIAYGATLMWGLTSKLYALGEWNRISEDEIIGETYSGKFGLELFRGIHIAAIADGTDLKSTYGYQVQLLPLVHWEVVGQVTKTETERGSVNTSTLMFHTYL